MKTYILLVNNENLHIAEVYNQVDETKELYKCYKYRKEASKETVEITVNKKKKFAVLDEIKKEETGGVSFVELKIEGKVGEQVITGFRNLGNKNWNAMEAALTDYIKEGLKKGDFYWFENKISGNPGTRELRRVKMRRR